MSSQSNQRHQTLKDVKSKVQVSARSKPIKPTTATQRGQSLFMKIMLFKFINSLYYMLVVPRRKPTTTSPDDDEEDVTNVDVSSQIHQRHCTTSNNAHQNSPASSEGDESAGDESAEDDPSEGDNDLSGLDSASLQKKISSEVKSLVFLFILCI